jgi:hypothetical protein
LLLLDDGLIVLERFVFISSVPQRQAEFLIEAVKSQGSDYFSLAPTAQGPASMLQLATMTQEWITPGTDPNFDVAAYSRAFETIETERWNVLSVDTNDTLIHTMMQMFLNRIYQNGIFVMGVVGVPATGTDGKSFKDRLTYAMSNNDYQIVFVGNGFIDVSGAVHEGYLAAARVAGVIAGTPSNEATTRLAIKNSIGLSEKLRNHQIETALKSGMLVFTRSSANTVWIEQGINTLVLPGTSEDLGWQKIKRVKVRFELFDRIVRTIDPLMGRINNNDDGRMTIIQLGNEVCNTMVSEDKLLPGAHLILDPDNPPQGDSAWFLVFADDVDALEKSYFAFGFRFAPTT